VLQPLTALLQPALLGVILPSLGMGLVAMGSSYKWGVACVWTRPWPKVYVTSRAFIMKFVDSPRRQDLSDMPEKLTIITA
jgi:hypothetical protein